jgi:VanZ family protein
LFSRLRRARTAALAWGVFLFALTSWPKPPEVPILSGIPNFDKVVHFALYAVESLLLYFAIRWPGRPGFSLLRVLALTGAMAAWGTVDEVHQTWIPGRSCDPEDALADTAGAAAGALVASVLTGTRRGRLLEPPSPRPSPGGRGGSR